MQIKKLFEKSRRKKQLEEHLKTLKVLHSTLLVTIADIDALQTKLEEENETFMKVNTSPLQKLQFDLIMHDPT